MPLTLVPTTVIDEQAATRRAWAIVADAYEMAAGIPGVAPEDRASFVRCAHTANQAARRPFETVDGGDA